MGNKPACVSWNGVRYWLNGGYYMSRNGRLLHRAVYRAHHGEIPPGYDVHHKDEDKTNYSPENLEALPRPEHLKRHRPRGAAASPKADRQERAWKMWGEIEPRAIVCVGCGKTFQSTGMRAKYCHLNCKMRHYHRTGRIVIPKKGRKTRPPKQCLVCGKPFKVSDPRTVTCGRDCGVRYRLRDRGSA